MREVSAIAKVLRCHKVIDSVVGFSLTFVDM